MKVFLVAIAKDEEKYIEEWVRFHIKCGFSKIILYDNESTDSTFHLAKKLGTSLPVIVNNWPGKEGVSPQRSAYNDAVQKHCQDADWVAFIDLDEYLIPWGYQSISNYLSDVPKDVSCVCINWMTFGSGGVKDPGYQSVIDTFTRRAKEEFDNNTHYKSIVRAKTIKEVRVHDVELKSGRRVLSDLVTKVPNPNARAGPIYNGIQINHYQTKTRSEFETRMARGNAGFPKGHPQHERKYPSSRFDQLDRNEIFDDCAQKYRDRLCS